MYKFLIVISLLVLTEGHIFSQTNRALIWRGFSHSWTYNHRINRLGSFVCMTDSSMNVCHTAASGLGADSCYFTSHYSLIESDRLHFQEGFVPIKLYGREKQLISKTIEVSIPANADMRKQDHYITLLNGFDLTAVGNADKLQLLRFSVEDAYYAPAVNELRFLVKVAIAFNCQSLECSRFNQKTTYDLKLHYLIVAGAHNYLTSTNKTITENYPWDKKIEFTPTPKQYSINGESEYLLPESTLGLKSMTITLDNAHWLLQYNNNVTPLDYKAETGKSTFASDLYFTEWQQGMKHLSAVPKHSRFSSKKSGWCMLDMEVVLLQFREAKVNHQKFSGSMFWGGLNNDPSVPEATKSKMIVVGD
jgi:hypothetical protein